MSDYKLSHLQELEAESIHIIREVAAEFENPVMLYSIGKDSSVMVRLAEKAFAPGKVPFPLMHIDSKWKFKEMVQFRDEYAKKFGLGEKTGIELDEEVAGHMASPEYKKEVVASATDREWFGGDTLQAAIGQSYSLFTPIQLANYAATIANGGTRYKVNLIKSVRSSVDGGVVKEFNPEVVEKVDMDDEVINAVKQGMKRVVDEGSASEIFANYGIAVGGKTGTAQVGNGSNNAVFIAFAPFDDPQIAVSVVLEHGVRGTNAAQVAKDIFDKYFNLDSADTTAEPTTATDVQGGLLR